MSQRQEPALEGLQSVLEKQIHEAACQGPAELVMSGAGPPVRLGAACAGCRVCWHRSTAAVFSGDVSGKRLLAWPQGLPRRCLPQVTAALLCTIHCMPVSTPDGHTPSGRLPDTLCMVGRATNHRVASCQRHVDGGRSSFMVGRSTRSPTTSFAAQPLGALGLPHQTARCPPTIIASSTYTLCTR